MLENWGNSSIFGVNLTAQGLLRQDARIHGLVIQYLWIEAINHIAVFSPNNVILRGIRYIIQRCD